MVRGQKLHRITFAKSVAERCAELSGVDYKVQKIELKLGAELGTGEASRSGLYALISRRKEKLLRVSLIRDAAELMCDNDSRYLRECFVLP